MIDINLTPKKIWNIKKYLNKVRDKKSADRLRIVLLRGEGWTYEKLSDFFNVSIDTVNRVLVLFKKWKYRGLIRNNYSGRVSRLSDEQLKELKRDVRKNLFGSSKEVAEHIDTKFKVDYSPNHITKLLHGLGFSYKKTKSVPVKSDINAQKEWIKKYNARVKELKEDEAIFFIDASHPIHNNLPDYVWIETGTNKIIPANSGRNRVNIVGAYSPQGNRVFTLLMNYVNKVSMTIFLLRLEMEYPELKKIYVYLDNAPCNKSHLITNCLEDSRVIVDFIPTYSPNLNLIERLWKFFKHKVMKNRYYETFSLFKTAIERFFANIEVYKKELKSLMRENFQLFTIS